MIYISQITAQPVNSAAPKSVQIDTVYTIGFGFITALFAAIIASVITPYFTYRLTKRQTKSNVFESKLEELEDLKVENAILHAIAGSENRLRAEMKSGFDELGRKIQDISDKMVSRFDTNEEKIHKLDIRVSIIESKE